MRQCASPLYPAERQRFEYSGQRMLDRIRSSTRSNLGDVAAGHADRGEMRNLSLNGMSFTSTCCSAEPNRAHRLRELHALARIAHVERDTEARGRFSAGVEFLTLRFRQVRGNFVSARSLSDGAPRRDGAS